MKRFYLSGQNNFGNRGCEALVRSTLQLLKAQFGQVEVLVPSFRPDLDKKNWPTAEAEGVKFVRAIDYPSELIWWGRAQTLFPFTQNLFLPNYTLPGDIEADLASVDALLLIGGDNITLDYGFGSLIWHARFAEHAQRLGKPVMIWGASIGPFTSNPVAERYMKKFLRSVNAITVRETISESYLRSIGVAENVKLVADPAFVMNSIPVDILDALLPAPLKNGILGFNVSPLICKFRPKGESENVLLSEVADFLRQAVIKHNLSILLLPHVDPLDGSTNNSDSYYMNKLLPMLADVKTQVALIPDNLNAPQLKHVLSQCRFFIGARTHATIGALSKLVPTISIAYSIKAKGLNKDLFGDESFVVETPSVSCTSLLASLELLIGNEAKIRHELNERIPIWKINSGLSAAMLQEVV